MKNLTIDDVENILLNAEEGTLIKITGKECGRKFILNGNVNKGNISISKKDSKSLNTDKRSLSSNINVSSKEIIDIFRILDPDRNNDCELQINNNDINILLTVKNNIISITQNVIQ